MKFEPLNGFVLIRKIELQDSSEGGVFVPASANNLGKDQGEVVAVAADLKQPVKAGDKVLYEQPSFAVVQNGETLLMVKEADVHIRIEE